MLTVRLNSFGQESSNFVFGNKLAETPKHGGNDHGNLNEIVEIKLTEKQRYRGEFVNQKRFGAFHERTNDSFVEPALGQWLINKCAIVTNANKRKMPLRAPATTA